MNEIIIQFIGLILLIMGAILILWITTWVVGLVLYGLITVLVRLVKLIAE